MEPCRQTLLKHFRLKSAHFCHLHNDAFVIFAAHFGCVERQLIVSKNWRSRIPVGRLGNIVSMESAPIWVWRQPQPTITELQPVGRACIRDRWRQNRYPPLQTPRWKRNTPGVRRQVKQCRRQSRTSRDKQHVEFHKYITGSVICKHAKHRWVGLWPLYTAKTRRVGCRYTLACGHPWVGRTLQQGFCTVLLDRSGSVVVHLREFHRPRADCKNVT